MRAILFSTAKYKWATYTEVRGSRKDIERCPGGHQIGQLEEVEGRGSPLRMVQGYWDW